MKKLWLYTAAGLLALTGTAKAFSYGEFISCNDINPRPAITFTSSYGKLYHILSASTEQINQIAELKPEYKEKGMFAEGLATAPIQMHLQIGTSYLQRLDDEYSCLMPQEVKIFVGYRKPEIYVSNTHDYQSCRFSVIIRHEQTHQRINKLTLEYYLPLIDKAIRNAVYEVRAVKVRTNDKASLDQGWEELYSHYIARLTPIVEELIRAREREHQKLDNLRNYKMEWDLCDKYDREHPADAQEKKQ